MKYVCVVGGANIDTSGTPTTPLSIHDSNPCHISVSLGGVGRNIAENLARLGIKVVLITAVGKDIHGTMVLDNAKQLNMDTTHTIVSNTMKTSNYICINDHLGDMFVAVSDMEILNELTPEYLSTKADIINNAVCVVTDANIPECAEYLISNCKSPVFVDTVSAKKTQLLKDKLHGVFALKPNIYEAEILSDITIENDNALQDAIDAVHRKTDAKWLCISDGSKGVYYSDGNCTKHCPAVRCDVVNTTGAGDSFMAGLVYGYYNGYSFDESVKLGCVASSITIQSKSTVSELMCEQTLLEKYKNKEKK